MKPPLSYIPLLPVLTGVVAGILCHRYLPSGAWAPVLLFVAGAACLLLGRRLVAVTLLSSLIGWAAGWISDPMCFETLPAEGVRFRGVVSDVREGESARTLTVKVDSCETEGSAAGVTGFRAVVTVPSFVPDIACGDVVSFSGEYSYPKRDVDLPMENDMSEFYYDNSISLLCFSPPDSLRLVGRDNSLLYKLRRLQSRVSDDIMTSGLEGCTAAFLSAVIAGDDRYIDEVTRDEFAASGVAHVLALSGAHVAVIATLVALLFFPLSVLGFRRLRWGATIAVLWAFAVMTGMSPSVTRSVTMATMVLLSLMLDRPRSVLNSLCLAAVIILLFDPHAIYKAGFQLSFVATLFIIIFSNRLNPFSVAGRNVIYGRFVNAAVVTVAATFGTMAIVAYHFHQFPVCFLFANIVAVFMMPVLIGGGIMLVAMSSLHAGTGWLAEALDWCYGVVADVAGFMSSLPGAVIDRLYFSGWLLVPFYLSALALLLLFVKKKRPYLVMSAGLMAFCIVSYNVMAPCYPDNELYITRQKDCATIVLRHRDSLSFITTAPEYMFQADSAEWVKRYSDYIGSRGVDRVDVVGMYDAGSPFARGSGGLEFGRTRIVSAISPGLPKADYCLVTKEFRGDIVGLAERSGCDTILVSNDIQSRRHDRFCRELRQASVPYRSLRESPFWLFY